MHSRDELILLRLNWYDVLLAQDALEASATSYERTAEWLACDARGGTYDYGDDYFVIEDVNSEEKARELAERYRTISNLLGKQVEEWEAAKSPQ